MKKSFFYVSGFLFVYAFNASVVVDMHTHFEFRCIFHNCFFVFIENQYSLSKILFDSMVDKQCRFYCIEKKKKINRFSLPQFHLLLAYSLNN